MWSRSVLARGSPVVETRNRCCRAVAPRYTAHPPRNCLHILNLDFAVNSTISLLDRPNSYQIWHPATSIVAERPCCLDHQNSCRRFYHLLAPPVGC